MNGDLSPLFPPAGEADFLISFAEKKLSFFAGDPAALSQLVSVEEIGRLVANGTLQSPRIRLVRSGNLVPETVWSTPDGPVDINILRSLLGKGATLVIDNLGPLVPILLEVEHKLERRLGARTTINAYLTEQKGGAFAAHYDKHDVLVIQVSGEKIWEIFTPVDGPAKSHQRWNDSSPGPTEVLIERTLRAGEMMFLPRGTWHRASVNDGASSLHLTVTIVSLTGHDFARWLVDQIEDDDLVCSDIPRGGGDQSIEAYERELQARIQSLFEKETIARFLEIKDGERTPVAINGLMAVTPPGEGDLLVPAMRRTLAAALGEDGGFELRAGGQSHRLTAPMATALRKIDESEGILWSDLQRQLKARWDGPIVDKAISTLLAKGLVGIKAGGDSDQPALPAVDEDKA